MKSARSTRSSVRSTWACAFRPPNSPESCSFDQAHPHHRRRTRRHAKPPGRSPAAACRACSTKCVPCAPLRRTRPTASPNWSAATRSRASRRIHRALAAQGGTAPPRFAAAAGRRRKPASPAGTPSPSIAALFAEEVTARHLRRAADRTAPRRGHHADRRTRSGSWPADRSPAVRSPRRSPRLTGSGRLYFYDSISPIVDAETVDTSRSPSGPRATASPPTAPTTTSIARSTATSTSISSMSC